MQTSKIGAASLPRSRDRRRRPRRPAGREGARSAARDDHHPPRQNRWYLHCAAICRRGPAAGRRLYRHPLCDDGCGIRANQSARARRDRLHFALLATAHIRSMPAKRYRSSPVCTSAASSCLRRTHPQHRGSQGQDRGRAGPGLTRHVFLARMAAHVGLDPAKDINWVTSPSITPMELFADGKIDALLGFPPEPQELRARKIGHVIVNSSIDRPWSQYFCCMLAGNRDFVRKHPVATKRVLRAILKATDFCASDPARAARRMVDGGFTTRYDYALQTLKEIPYAKWREYDPEDTIRFYALRLREAGMIKSNPNKIIAEGTDWRFFNELKRELKG